MSNSDTSSVSDGISVVVTCYNLENYISDALQSVREQCRPGKFEVIVVDDCSTDNSAIRIKSFPEARYIRTKSNGGVLQAMILGVGHAQYDKVALLDGDDVWEVDKLQKLREAFESDDELAFVTHDLTFVDAEGQPVQKPSLPKLRLGSFSGENMSERVRHGILSHGDYIWLGSAFSFRKGKAAFDEFSEFVQTLPDPANCYQDWPFAYWIAHRPDVRLGYLDRTLLRYRLHTANHSGDVRTLASALRNFTRTRNTLDAIQRISLSGGRSKWASNIARRLRFVQSQVDLYAGRRLTAATGFIQSLGFLVEIGQARKESMRFALGILFGPKLLTNILSRR